MDDVLIVGGGPAGLAAARALAHNGIRARLIERASVVGGVLRSITYPIGDSLGLGAPDGPALAARLEQDTAALRIERGVDIRTLRRAQDVWVAERDDSAEHAAPRVIVATGTQPRRLGLPHEQLLDGPAREGPVVVIGGGDEASTTAYAVAQTGASVTVVARRAIRARRQFLDPLLNHPGITVRSPARVVRLLGTTALEAVVLDTGETLPAARCLLRIGVEPTAPLVGPNPPARGPDQTWVVDLMGRTSLPGLYAIGDLTVPGERRYLTGAIASGVLVARAVEEDRDAEAR